MSEIPEVWEDWFQRLSNVLTELDDLSHEHHAEITLPAAIDVQMAAEAPGFTAWDEWHELISENVWSPCAHGTELGAEREGFCVFYCFAVDISSMSVEVGTQDNRFPSEKLTDLYLQFLSVFGELRQLPDGMRTSFSGISPSCLVEEVPRRFILQDLLLTMALKARLTPGQAVLAFALDPVAAECFPEALEPCRNGLNFHGHPSTWDDYRRTMEAEEEAIHNEASKNSLELARLDDPLVEQVLTLSYLSAQRHHEAVAVLSHLIAEHSHDSHESFGIGPDDWWGWLRQSLEEIEDAVEVMQHLLATTSLRPDPAQERIADIRDGHRIRVEDRLADVLPKLDPLTKRLLVEAEEQWGRAMESWMTEDEREFSVKTFAVFTQAAIENEASKCLSQDALSTLPATPGKLGHRLEEEITCAFVKGCGGDPETLRRLLNGPIVSLLTRWRNAALHGGEVRIEEAEARRIYSTLWGVGNHGDGWLLRYFGALPRGNA